MSQRELGLLKRKRPKAYNSDEEEVAYYSTYISEERYRTMLGEHIQKYKRRLNNNSSQSLSTRIGIGVTNGSVGSMDRKSSRDEHRGSQKVETNSDFLTNFIPWKIGINHESNFASEFDADRFAFLLRCYVLGFFDFAPVLHAKLDLPPCFHSHYTLPPGGREISKNYVKMRAKWPMSNF